MKNRNGKAGDPVWHAEGLPGTFTTGFRRDMHIARDIIRRRRKLQLPQAQLNKTSG